VNAISKDVPDIIDEVAGTADCAKQSERGEAFDQAVGRKEMPGEKNGRDDQQVFYPLPRPQRG
jgi:hypothetical protein